MVFAKQLYLHILKMIRTLDLLQNRLTSKGLFLSTRNFLSFLAFSLLKKPFSIIVNICLPSRKCYLSCIYAIPMYEHITTNSYICQYPLK